MKCKPFRAFLNYLLFRAKQNQKFSTCCRHERNFASIEILILHFGDDFFEIYEIPSVRKEFFYCKSCESIFTQP